MNKRFVYFGIFFVIIVGLAIFKFREGVVTSSPTATQPVTTTVSGIDNIVKEPSSTMQISLYFYNIKKDQEISGDNNIACSNDAILPVTRLIPVTKTPIQDAIKLLLKGEVTAEEKKQGFQTEFPNAQFTLKGANLVKSVLTLEFNDPTSFTGGGSCRTGILAGQIKKTALQFPEVKEVRFTPPDTLFQP